MALYVNVQNDGSEGHSLLFPVSGNMSNPTSRWKCGSHNFILIVMYKGRYIKERNAYLMSLLRKCLQSSRENVPV